jgi:ribosomal protein S18 acetylase RimI-like enzyme
MSTMAAARAPGLVRGLQERAAQAFPAVCLKHLDGWWLRHDDSGAWWASSVLPHSDAVPVDLPGRIRFVEEFYAGHGACARFQISPGACPAGLDEALAERGYRIDSPMSLQSAPTAHTINRLPTGELRIRVDDQPTDAWFETWLAVHGTGGDPSPERDMLRRVDRLSAYASVLTGADVIAVGRAVTETGWAGVFGMATLPHARGTGAARHVLAALAHWAAHHGAAHMYLQVECDNTAARRLYERAGFIELCRYHYRTGGRYPARMSDTLQEGVRGSARARGQASARAWRSAAGRTRSRAWSGARRGADGARPSASARRRPGSGQRRPAVWSFRIPFQYVPDMKLTGSAQ